MRGRESPHFIMFFLAYRKHLPAVVLALLVGLNLILPALWAKFRFGIDFNHPVNIRADDEPLYYSRIRDVRDGYPMLGNPYFWEHKSKPPAPVFLGEYLTAKVTQFFGLEPVAAGVFFDFFLPAVGVLLTYACFFAVTRLGWVSLVGTAFLFWGLFMSKFGRAVSPQLNFLFWLSMFWLLYHLVTSTADRSIRRWMIAVLAAVNFGLLFYLYTYYWTFYLVFIVLLAIAFAVHRDFNLAKALGFIVGRGFIIAIPYFVIMRQALALPEYSETLRRIGMIDSHFPSGIAIVIPGMLLLALATLLLRARIIRWDLEAAFFVSGVVAALASVNQHVITGKNLEFSSHYYMLAMFWFAFTAAYFFKAHWMTRERFRRWIAGGLLVIPVMMVMANLSEVPNLFLSSPEARTETLNRYLPVFHWLNEHTQKDEVVLAPFGLADLIPIYTANNVYFATPAHLAFMSDAELLDRFILNRLGETLDDEFIRRHIRSLSGGYDLNRAGHQARQNIVRAIFGLPVKQVNPVPAETILRVRERIEELREQDLATALKKYRVDYVLRDIRRQPPAPLATLSFLTKVEKIDDFVVYRVR